MKRSEHPVWKRVARIYRAYGLIPFLDLECLPEGVVYVRGQFALAGDPENFPTMALHDLAHWAVAPDSRRDAENFGLGPHPASEETKDVEAQVRGSLADAEEAYSSRLHCLMVRQYFGEKEYLRCAGFLSIQDEDSLARPDGLFSWKSPHEASYRKRLAARGFYVGGELSVRAVIA